MNRKQLEAIVHEEVQSFTESMLNENPAVIATAARMAIQNKQGKKVKRPESFEYIEGSVG